LYFKDLKTFLGLKRVAEHSNRRRLKVNQTGKDFKKLNDEQLLTKTRVGRQDMKIIYDQGASIGKG